MISSHGDTQLSNDMITELPENVIERILLCLPLRDAVRTSILSREWRYKWVTLPRFIFDEQYFVPANIINRILLLHRGPIEKFKLSNSNIQSCSDIDLWIHFLSRNNIKEFILYIRKGGRHIVPSCLFSCKELIHLELEGCIFKSIPTFVGFNNLKSLELRKITFVGSTFESLISSCPLLERLTLLFFDGLIDIKIHAPNLKYLFLAGPFKSICFKNTLLSTAMLNTTNLKEEFGNVEHTSSLGQVLGGLPRIVNLYLNGNFLKLLGLGNVPNNRIKRLGLIGFNFKDLDVVSAAICLIKRTPKLQFLKIRIFPNRTSTNVELILEFLKTQHSSECSLNRLRVVDITCISGQITELEFLKFLLSNAPRLELMNVELENKKDAESVTFKELLGFHRASPKAEIVFLDRSWWI